MKVFGSEQLQSLQAQAAASARRRMNYNLHASPADTVQRMCNAFEPGTYVRPHRHSQPNKWELFVALSGHAVALTFDDNGMVTQRIGITAGEGNRIVEIPANTWHTVASLQPGTVMFEVKEGPYEPCPDKDFASWAPQEGDDKTSIFVDWFRTAQPGSMPPSAD